ncbi:hypothetical protein ACFX15_017310 [Malus domestica]
MPLQVTHAYSHLYPRETHRCCNNRKPKRNVKVAKPTYDGEHMEQESRIPVSLHKYFRNDFFQQCTTVACHMVEVEIEKPSKGKAIAVKEKKTPIMKQAWRYTLALMRRCNCPKR